MGNKVLKRLSSVVFLLPTKNLNMAKVQIQTFSKTMNPVTFCTAHQTLTGTKYTTQNTILAICNI